MERVWSKLEQDILREIESRVPFIIEDSEGELSRSEAEERACEGILAQADEMGMFYFFEYALKKMGFYPYPMRKENPYAELVKPKAQYDLEQVFGIEIPSFFRN